MARIEGNIVIKRSTEEVFDFLADERNEARYNPGTHRLIEQTPEGPMSRGTRYRGERPWMGVTLETTTEVTDYERPRLLASKSQSSLRLIKRMAIMDGQATTTLEPIEDGTLLRWSWDLHARGFLKIFSYSLGRTGRKQSQTIYRNLKRVMEEAPAHEGEAR